MKYVLEYGIHALDKSGLGGLAVRHPDIGRETQVQFLVRPDFESHQYVGLPAEWTHPYNANIPYLCNSIALDFSQNYITMVTLTDHQVGQ